MIAGYPYTNQVTDDNAKKAIIAAFDLLTALRSEIDTVQRTITVIQTVVPGTGGPIPPGPMPPVSVTPTFGSLNPGDLLTVDAAGTVIGLPDTAPGNAVLSSGPGVIPHYGLASGSGLTQPQALKLVSFRG